MATANNFTGVRTSYQFIREAGQHPKRMHAPTPCYNFLSFFISEKKRFVFLRHVIPVLRLQEQSFFSV